MEYLRWNSFRVKHADVYKEGDTFVAYGWLCDRDKTSDKDKRVSIYHRHSVGYTYKDRA